MKLFDCFMFYNELDMLTYRLNLLYDHVDYFVIAEATHTHSGKEKQMHFLENKALFEAFKDKIIHVIVDDFPYKYPHIDYGKNQQWENEKFQRNAIMRGVEKIGDLSDDDVITITDLDEIPNPKTLTQIRSQEITFDMLSLEMDFYYYNLNTKQKIKWTQAKVITYQHFKTLGKVCSDLIKIVCPLIPNGGWHLSYFGDEVFIQNKLLHFAHQEFNSDHYTNAVKIKQRVETQSDLFGYSQMINISVENNNNLPPLYDKFLTKYYRK
jgi:beta-1,4-mannosyl-glycoprotein beta-1,4-N-acetylglucosaminyltransferase